MASQANSEWRTRFEAKINKNGPISRLGTRCHEWTACLHKQGYGKFKLNGEVLYAHRVAWVLKNGEIPEGIVVRHDCDNSKCVNDEHLLLGTHYDNVADRVERGRTCNQYVQLGKRLELAAS